MIQLSILIPSIPSRFEKAAKLYRNLLALAGDMKVEVIILMDNKVMSIGEKHNNLLSTCHGKYFMFCHDDDEIIDLEDIYAATFFDTDVIDFNAKCLNVDGSTFIVTQKLGNEVEHNTKDGKYLDCNRPPFPNCAWNNRFKHIKFPEISYAEDWGWVKQCLPYATTETFIDKILFKYNFNPEVSEASTEDNEQWKNPNHHMESRVVVNFATPNYRNSQNRLKETLKEFWDGDVLFFDDYDQIGSPTHQENPFAFKVYAIEKAIDLGYTRVLWLDSSCYAIKNIQPVFDSMESDGMIFQEAGHWLSTWTNDRTLEYFGITREEGECIMMIGNAGFLGFNFNNEIAVRFLLKWNRSMLDGMFNGDSKHRWDMSCSSAIVYKMGLSHLMKKGNQWLQYASPEEQPNDETVIFKAQGIN